MKPSAAARHRKTAAPERSREARSTLSFGDPTAPFLVPGLVLLASRLFFWFAIPFGAEDAYITYRYSRNVVRGLGAVYNAGERVLGTSSPLWMAWNALGIALVREPVFWSRLTTIALELLALWAVARLLARWAGRLAAWSFALFYAAWPYFAATAVSGMETSAVFALLGLSAFAAARRSAWSGPLLGALALSRPEGLALAAAVALAAGWRDRLIGLAILLAGVAWLTAYYGSPVPQSVVAKAAVYGTPGPLAGRAWWEWISPFALGRWPVTSEGAVLFALASVSAPALVAGTVALARRWREARALAALALGGAIVWLAYAALGVAYFAWYLVVPLGTAAVLAAAGLPRVVRGRWLPVSLALYVAGSWTVLPRLYVARAAAEYQSFDQAAETLGLNSNPGQSVFLEPIGMVGWVCRLRVIDEIGLVSPPVAARRRAGDGWMADVIRERRPDWLVTRRGIAEGANGGAAFAGRGRPFRDDAERVAVLAPYRLLATIHPAAGDEAMEIRGLALPARPVSPPNGEAAGP